MFAWSAAIMPRIDPSVACHQLTVNPSVSAITQRRRKQSPEKSEAAEKAVKDLLEENFISEAKYTTWLSNVVLVKKSNGKWRMCVDYTDLNRAFPKDAYPLPNTINSLIIPPATNCYPSWTPILAITRYPWQKKINRKQPSLPNQGTITST